MPRDGLLTFVRLLAVCEAGTIKSFHSAEKSAYDNIIRHTFNQSYALRILDTHMNFVRILFAVPFNDNYLRNDIVDHLRSQTPCERTRFNFYEIAESSYASYMHKVAFDLNFPIKVDGFRTSNRHGKM